MKVIRNAALACALALAVAPALGQSVKIKQGMLNVPALSPLWLLPDEAKKHEDFVNRMVEKGYTHRQVRLLCEWYLRVRKSS